MYSIGQVSEMFGIPVSTLRYYDREGLLPELERSSGRRAFSEKDLEALRVIECLKASGLEIKEIRQFMDWCGEGADTYPQRKELFESRKRAVESEIQRLEQVLCLLRYKCWYYGKACEDGNEDGIAALLPDKLPEEIQKLYDIGQKCSP